MRKGIEMDTRVAVISIIVENPEAIVTLNDLLHEAGNYIIGRMGIPYREKGINIISIAIDAPQDIINTLAGKLGKVEGISAKTCTAGYDQQPFRKDRKTQRCVSEDCLFKHHYKSGGTE